MSIPYEESTPPSTLFVIVTFNSDDVIAACIRSIQQSNNAHHHVLIVDNASTDNTIAGLQDAFADIAVIDDAGQFDQQTGVTIFRSRVNSGYAGGVNIGLSLFRDQDAFDYVWILNPDCEIEPGTLDAFVDQARANPGFGMMGGRIVYQDTPDVIQSDGGRVNMKTGICSGINQYADTNTTSAPSDNDLMFIGGASIFASRAFVERVGLMREDYFLFYEEVDWAFRRGELPVLYCGKARILHHGGTSTGSARQNQRPSPFTNYFNFRNRIWFMRAFAPQNLLFAYIYALLKIGKLVMLGAWDEAWAAFAGTMNLLPPAAVRDRLSPDARKLAFSR